MEQNISTILAFLLLISVWFFITIIINDHFNIKIIAIFSSAMIFLTTVFGVETTMNTVVEIINTLRQIQ